MSALGDVIDLLEAWYDPKWAQSWDSVGLVAGDRGGLVEVIHIAVDPTIEVAEEAVACGADLLITHHPLWLGGTDHISGPKGKVFSALRDAGCAHYVAHTNADVASPGVSDALARALGLGDLTVLSGQDDEFDRWVVHVPDAHVQAVLDRVAQAGGGKLGAYDRCAFVSAGTGTFRPLDGASPFLGEIGKVESVAEARIEFVAPGANRWAIAAAIRAAHPYEEPSFSAVASRTPSQRGLGRVGRLPVPMTLNAFVAHVAARLPATAAGVRATGDPEALVECIAVAGGSCLDLEVDASRADADVLVTSDAKHHRAQEAGVPVVDVAHWAGEWPWTDELGARLRAALSTVAVSVSGLVTDPWTMSCANRVDSGS